MRREVQRVVTGPVVLCLLSGLALTLPSVQAGDSVGAAGATSPASSPDTIELVGTVRDFAERTVSGGHTDFEGSGRSGFSHGQYARIVQDQLGEDGKPVFRSKGYKVNSGAKDGSGRHIIDAKEYIESRSDDRAASISTTEGGTVASAESLNSWYRDDIRYNASRPLAITLKRKPGSTVYVFDDKEDSKYSGRGGFFPVNGELKGNSGGGGRANTNYHFTYELATQFTYDAEANHVFTFTGDDDVWVYVDGKLVIDIGGTHSAISQTIELNRLNWLEDGRTYTLHFFFAERHRTASNFRIETTLNLRNVEPPQVSGNFD